MCQLCCPVAGSKCFKIVQETRSGDFFFFKRGGSELMMSGRIAKKKGAGSWIEAFQSAFRRIPEEASRELTGEGRKVCVCVDGKARQDLNSEPLDL